LPRIVGDGSQPVVLPGLKQLEATIAEATRAVDPTAVLLADHEWLRSLLEAHRPSVQRGEKLGEIHAATQALKPRLDLHIRREEQAYFPAVEESLRESGRGSTLDMYGEHDAIRIRLDELLVALDLGTGVADAYAAFSRSLLIHFENEEELVFSEAPAHLSERARRQILSQFEALAA
jgi:hemerythrin-like domain-containing protein